jgi:Ca-activated chloride channel family protein
MAFCSVQLITERNRTATALRDAGQVQQAKKLLQQNANELQVLALKCKDNNVLVVVPELVRNYETNALQASNIDDDRNWARSRKVMREYQNSNEQQQTYSAPNR